MPPKKIVNVAFEAQTSNQSLYASGLPLENPSHVSVEKGTTLGEISDDFGKKRYFIVKNNTDRTDSKSDPNVQGSITFAPALVDYSYEIEKTRTNLYNSYAALLFSLPALFFSKGMTIANQNSLSYNRGDSSAVAQWQMYSNYSTAATITLGANFLFQLGRYLFTANKILPQTVDITEKSGSKILNKIKGLRRRDLTHGRDPRRQSSRVRPCCDQCSCRGRGVLTRGCWICCRTNPQELQRAVYHVGRTVERKP